MTRAADGHVGGHVIIEATWVAGDPVVTLRFVGQPRVNEIVLSPEEAQRLAEVMYGKVVAFRVNGGGHG